MSQDKQADAILTVLIGKPKPFQVTLGQLKDTLERLHYSAFWLYPPLSAYQFRPDGVWLDDQQIAEYTA